MVCRVNHDTDNARHRLLTIQHRLSASYVIAVETGEDLEDKKNSIEERGDGSTSDTFIPCARIKACADLSCELPVQIK